MPAALTLLGLLLGSFLNVCIHRLPLGRSIVSPRSACPHCARPINAYDNIPLLSWLLLRGRCRHCRLPIALRYPAVELATALLFLASALHFPTTMEIAKYCYLSAILIVLFFTDLEHQLLPDAVTLPGIALGLLVSLFVFVAGIPGIVLAAPSHRLVWLLQSVIGAATGAAFLFLLAEIYLRARGVHGMGLGDVKLVALIGAFLGFRLVLFTIFAAAAAGSLLGIAALALLYRKRLRRYRLPTQLTQPRPQRPIADDGITPGTPSVLTPSVLRGESWTAGSAASAPEKQLRPSPWPPVALRRKSPRARAWSSARLLLRHLPIPFGSLLSAAALLACFFGDRILHWYWNLF